MLLNVGEGEWIEDESWASLYNVEWYKIGGNPGYDVNGKLSCH